jgi:hypothetical protein
MEKTQPGFINYTSASSESAFYGALLRDRPTTGYAQARRMLENAGREIINTPETFDCIFKVNFKTLDSYFSETGKYNFPYKVAILFIRLGFIFSLAWFLASLLFRVVAGKPEDKFWEIAKIVLGEGNSAISGIGSVAMLKGALVAGGTVALVGGVLSVGITVKPLPPLDGSVAHLHSGEVIHNYTGHVLHTSSVPLDISRLKFGSYTVSLQNVSGTHLAFKHITSVRVRGDFAARDAKFQNYSQAMNNFVRSIERVENHKKRAESLTH